MKKYYFLIAIISVTIFSVSCSKADETEDLLLGTWEIYEVKKSKLFGSETFPTILTNLELTFAYNGICDLIQDDTLVYNSGTWNIEMETYTTGIVDDETGMLQQSVREVLYIEWNKTIGVLNESYFSKINSSELELHGESSDGDYLYYYCNR